MSSMDTTRKLIGEHLPCRLSFSIFLMLQGCHGYTEDAMICFRFVHASESHIVCGNRDS